MRIYQVMVVVGLILVMAMIGCASAKDPPTEGAVTDRAMTVPLSPRNNSRISGTAMLIPRGTQTQVLLSVSGESTDATKPADIHLGHCGRNLGPVAYPLNDVQDGQSKTTVNAPLSSIADGDHTIDVDQSTPPGLVLPIACGDIPQP